MAQITQEELSKRINKNGWQWCLISNATPGIIRIQLSDDGEEEMGWRKCVEASTIDEAVSAAEAFVSSITPDEYWRQNYGSEAG